MHDIDFIKWMCKHCSAYYDEIENTISFPDQKGFSAICYLYTPQFDIVYYPLLLQRAIEGVNRENPEWLQINQCGYSIQILTDCNRDVVKNFDIIGTSDQAKEVALRYVYEQEQEDE